MSQKICQHFAQVPQYKVLIMDISAPNYTQNFYFLRGAFPYGLPIVFSESIWNIPTFEVPVVN